MFLAFLTVSFSRDVTLDQAPVEENLVQGARGILFIC